MEEAPAGIDLENVNRLHPLVLPVIPFLKLGIDDRLSTESRDLAGLPRAGARAGQHARELQLRQPRAHQFGAVPTFGGQRRIRPPRVLARQRPFGLAMSRQIDSRQTVVHRSNSHSRARPAHAPLTPRSKPRHYSTLYLS